MALTGDVYSNDSSSDSEGTVEMEEKQHPKNYPAAAAAAAYNDAVHEEDDTNTNEHNYLTESKLQQHNNQQIDSESATNTYNDEKEAAASSAGAGLLFGFSGLLLGGPIFGTIAGVSAAIVASNHRGRAGDNARAVGDFAVTTGSMVGEVARDVNKKHGILNQIQNSFASGWRKVRQFDEDHHASEKVKETMSNVSDKVVGFEREHHFFENMLEGILNGVQFLLEKVRGATENNKRNECA
jgi:hypothetical protein